jgi:hypothetical protein
MLIIIKKDCKMIKRYIKLYLESMGSQSVKASDNLSFEDILKSVQAGVQADAQAGVQADAQTTTDDTAGSELTRYFSLLNPTEETDPIPQPVIKPPRGK